MGIYSATQPEPATSDAGRRKGTDMTIDLPRPIAAYFEADGSDGDAVADCFTEQAVVKDERRTHVGRPAIAQWKAESSARYSYTSAPFAVEDRDGRTVVTAHLTGNFPGSPVDLTYVLVLDGDRIGSLEIAP